MTKDKKFGVAVKGIIRRNDGKILIVKRSPEDDHAPEIWETVGGGMDEAVSMQETLQREIQEEVGLEVEVSEPFSVFSFTNDSGEFKVGITFLCELTIGEVRLSPEHSEYRWIDPADFKNYPSVVPLYREIGAYANKFTGEHERFIISQKAILIREGKCFIAGMANRHNLWDLPGGRINNDEDGELAFRREIKEELGTDNFKIVSVLDYATWHTKHGFAVCGTVRLIETDEEINLSDEHTGGKWITEDEIDTHEFIWPAMSRMIKKGFEYYKKHSSQ